MQPVCELFRSLLFQVVKKKTMKREKLTKVAEMNFLSILIFHLFYEHHSCPKTMCKNTMT